MGGESKILRHCVVQVGVGCGGPNAYSYRNISQLLFNLFVVVFVLFLVFVCFFFLGGGADLLISPTSLWILNSEIKRIGRN